MSSHRGMTASQYVESQLIMMGTKFLCTKLFFFFAVMALQPLLMLGGVDCTLADEAGLDPQLFRDIVKGHKFLEQSTENLTGTNFIYRNLQDTDFSVDTEPSRRINFYKSGDLLRLDYIQPVEGTTISPGHPYNDITDVFLHTKDYDYRYMATYSTGVPYANLLKSKTPDEKIQITLRSDFYQDINFLFSLEGMRVIEMLQRKIGKVEKRIYSDVPEAIWITGVDDEGENGDIASWVVVLNPNQHYALLYHEGCIKHKKTNKSIFFSNKIISQKLNNEKLLPKEIILESEVYGTRRMSKSQIAISSTEKPDGKIFSETCFKDMERDYVVVNVLPNQKQVPGNWVGAALLEALMPPEYNATRDILNEKDKRTDWTLTHISLLVSGIVLLLIMFVQNFLKWYRKQSRDKL